MRHRITDDERVVGYGAIGRDDRGEMTIAKSSSYSALLHEFQHVKDAKEHDWDGAHILYEDEAERIRREERAYSIEVEYAERLGREDIADRLREALKLEIKHIHEFFGTEAD